MPRAVAALCVLWVATACESADLAAQAAPTTERLPAGSERPESKRVGSTPAEQTPSPIRSHRPSSVGGGSEQRAGAGSGPDTTLGSALAVRVESAICDEARTTESFQGMCGADRVGFVGRDWRGGGAGFITLETETMDRSVVAWRTTRTRVIVRVVGVAMDGSGGGVHNLAALSDIAVDEPDTGQLSARLKLSTSETESCTTTLDAETHLVVCGGDDFVCGSLRVETESAVESDPACCRGRTDDGCENDLRSAHRCAVSYANGRWTVSKPQGKGQPQRVAEEGSYDVAALTTAHAISRDGLQL